MRISPLLENWAFQRATPGVGYWRPNEPANPWRPAVVPGCIHDDLVRCLIIADPFLLEHEAGCEWVDEEDWLYRTSFEWVPDASLPKRILRFEGLDTVCAVKLNGQEILRHDNMHLPAEVDASEFLVAGTNVLEVRFDSVVRVGMERRAKYFEANGISHDTSHFDERAFVRKVQCMSGWDWGPRLVSCGVFRPVSLLEFESRIINFEVFQERLEDGRFRVWSETQVEGSAKLTTHFCDRAFEGDFDCVVEDPHLWWPNGMGEPFLYTAVARLSTGQEVVRRVGLRTIRLLQEPDERGTGFEFEINGRHIFATGANWIPNDSFPSRISNEDLQRQIETCQRLGMNMLRVWGGGHYEAEAFYDACDERGIMVWQDFPFACSYAPDGPEEQAILAREAEHHVRRLRGRASLALWCGNNENDVMWTGKWGGTDLSPDRYFGDCLYNETLREVCHKLDPDRPYIRSSPIGGHDEGKAWGDEHVWDVWHGRGDWRFYAESRTRFCSEFGFASSCSSGAWRRAGIESEQADPNDLPVRWHDKTNKPWEVFRGMVELHYPPADNLEDWIYWSQLNQRDALRFGVEHYRTNGWCRGALIWQLNDCWPVQSWAVQDYSRQLKPAGFELKRLFAPTVLSLVVETEELVIRAANEGAGAVLAAAEIEFYDMSGNRLNTVALEAEIPPGEPRTIGRIAMGAFDRTNTVVCGSFLGRPESATWRTLAEPKDMWWVSPVMTLENGALHIKGLAYDIVLLSEGAQWEGQNVAGRPAVCTANGSFPLCLASDVKAIRVRTMAGDQEIEP